MNYLKQFMVFTYGEYYPMGGLDDCLGAVDTLEEAKKLAFSNDDDYKTILDIVEGNTYVFQEGDWAVSKFKKNS